MNTLTITWDQLNDIKSPAASPVVIIGLLESIDSTIAERGQVQFTSIDGVEGDILNNEDDLIRWKQQNAEWLP